MDYSKKDHGGAGKPGRVTPRQAGVRTTQPTPGGKAGPSKKTSPGNSSDTY